VYCAGKKAYGKTWLDVFAQINTCSRFEKLFVISGGEAMDTSENAEESQSETGEGATNGGKRRELPEDEVPWGSLASFALFRLFSEWESQGTHVPFPPGAAVKAKPAVSATFRSFHLSFEM